METERRSYFGSVAETYEKTRPGYPSIIVERINAYAGHARGGSALDVGCGTGKGTACLIAGGWQVTGIDIDERMLDVARSAVPQARFLASEVSHLSEQFEPQNFDLVAAFAAAHWFVYDAEIAQLRHVLKPGGALCLINRERALEDTFHATIKEVLSGYVRQWPRAQQAEVGFDARNICKRVGCTNIKAFKFQQADPYTPREAAQFARTKSYFAHVPQKHQEHALRHLKRVFEDQVAARGSQVVENVSLMRLVCGRLPG
jgi:ubiquinone/menaquinone biosynthesis C-methylase UbiE